jgi:hypothetical protein
MPQITITPATDRAGKLADADLVFTHDDGAILAGLRLTGFSIWRSRYDGAPRVLPPSRQYWKDGEKRTYGLLRDAAGTLQQDHPLIAVILREYDRATRPAPRPAPVTEAAARASWDAAIAASRPQAQPPAIAPASAPPARLDEQPERYDTPDAAAAAARAGKMINISDLIPKISAALGPVSLYEQARQNDERRRLDNLIDADPTNASETREHHAPTQPDELQDAPPALQADPQPLPVPATVLPFARRYAAPQRQQTTPTTRPTTTPGGTLIRF